MKTAKEFTKRELDKLRKLTKADLVVLVANKNYIIRQYEDLLTKRSNVWSKNKAKDFFKLIYHGKSDTGHN